jgi:flotillin
VALAVGAFIFIVFILGAVWAKRYVKAGPNQVLIISGRRHRIRRPDGTPEIIGFRTVKGGGAFIWPVLEKLDILSLEILTIEVRINEVYTKPGVQIYIDGVSQVKIKGDDVSIRTSSEQFLSKGAAEMKNVILQTLEGHLRAIVGTLTVEEIYSNRDAFAYRVQEVAAADLANMGLTIISFTIRDIKDQHGYLDALGRPRTAQVKRDAVIGEAEANRDATIKSAQANQMGQTAKFLADTKIAESSRDYEMNVANYQASVNERRAVSDLAYDLQKYQTAQLVKAQEVEVQVVEKKKQIEVQESEIKRKENELQAVVAKPAEAERYKIHTLAEAEKTKLETVAQGEAAAVKHVGFAAAEVIKAKGTAEADANKAKGLAQAEVIRAQGLSEAQAMMKKAEAWKYYNQAAIIQMLIDKMPEIARAVAEPLAKTERIVIVNTGGEGGGASKVTGDITKIIAQLPPVIEALSGLDLNALLKKLQPVSDEPLPPEPSLPIPSEKPAKK